MFFEGHEVKKNKYSHKDFSALNKWKAFLVCYSPETVFRFDILLIPKLEIHSSLCPLVEEGKSVVRVIYRAASLEMVWVQCFKCRKTTQWCQSWVSQSMLWSLDGSLPSLSVTEEIRLFISVNHNNCFRKKHSQNIKYTLQNINCVALMSDIHFSNSFLFLFQRENGAWMKCHTALVPLTMIHNYWRHHVARECIAAVTHSGSFEPLCTW